MDQLIILLLVITIAVVLHLYSRVKTLEKQIQGKTPNSNPRTSPKSSQPAQTPINQSPSPTHDPLQPIISWLKEEWLIKLGALLLLIAFGWLTTYAFLNNWIGPIGRISLGILVGILFTVLGWWRIKKYLHQGSIFLVLGSTTILISVFAAQQVYSLFTPLSALTIMFLSTTLVALASIKYHNKALALVSLLLAAIAPLLTGSSSADYIGLFSYLFIVTLGTVWLVFLTGTRELTLAAQIILWIYSIPLLSSLTDIEKQQLLPFVFAFTALFFITNITGILKLKNKDILPDIISAASTGVFILTWIISAAPDQWQSLLIIGWMIVFAAGAYLSLKMSQQKAFYTYTGLSILMLAAATAVELNGPLLTIAFTIESILIITTFMLLKNTRVAHRTSLLLLAPTLLVTQSITSEAWSTSIVHLDFLAIFCLAATLLGVGAYFLPYSKKSQDKDTLQLNRLLLIAGSGLLYILLWLSLHAILQQDSLATMICLIIYTLIGLTTHFAGLTQNNKTLQLYGNALIGIVAIRLLLVDVWDMELTGRIITFFLIGIILLSTAFVDKKKLGLPQLKL